MRLAKVTQKRGFSRQFSGDFTQAAPSPSLPKELPKELREHGIAAVHQRPYCANEDSHIVGRFDSAYAFATFPKLEIQPPHAYVAIILDCDTPSESGWPGGKPSIPPSWLVVNTRPGTPERRPGGIHAVYALEVPVARHNAAHTLPLSYLAHVADRLGGPQTVGVQAPASVRVFTRSRAGQQNGCTNGLRGTNP